MTTSSIEFKILNLRKEYRKYSRYLLSMQSHINRCLYDHLISDHVRNQYFKKLNDNLRKMNDKYNSYIHPFFENKQESEYDKTLDSESLENKYDDLYFQEYIKKSLENSEDSCIDLNIFNEINEDLLDIGKKIGFQNINTGLEMIIGKVYRKMVGYDVRENIDFYDDIFIPLSYGVLTNSSAKYSNFCVCETDTTFTNLISQPFRIIIKDPRYNNKYIYFDGHGINDNLNIIIRTSQICNEHIYKKKKKIEQKLSEEDISNKFTTTYIRNTSLSELLTLKPNQHVTKLNEEYSEYQDLNKSQFVKIIKDISNCEIQELFNKCKLLLYSSDENNNLAALIFNLIRSKKLGNENLAQLIYKNLSFSSQVKLKKSVFNIKNEIKKLKSLSNNEVDVVEQIMVCKNMPTAVKKFAIEKAEEMKSMGSEYHKQSLYVKILLRFPWPSDDDDRYFQDLNEDRDKSVKFLDDVKLKLDKQVYGHKECKNTILQLIAKWITNPQSSGSAMGLVGPPGVGKTIIAKAIGQALNIPFIQMSLGGQNDGEMLFGHGYTYNGAQPGMVVKKMVEAGSARCIMYFDELDKACKKHDTNEIFSILIHMTDPNTNGEFQDRFFQEIAFPLQKVIFIFSYNDAQMIDKILLDRLIKIRVDPYTMSDKMEIAKKFLVKEFIDVLKLDIEFTDDAIEYIIDEYTHEAGVRELKRKIEALFLKMNLDKIYGKDIFEKAKQTSGKLQVDRDLVIKYLDKPQVSIKEVHKEDLVGVINGLYATENGQGGIVPIQIYNHFTGSKDGFTLKLTGSQGKVMKESVVSACTTAMNTVKEDVRKDFFKEHSHGFHIHTPSGATPKDGPSAGCAFTVAFTSVVLNKKIRHDVGITGEIELTGQITKIGGLLYKLIGAKKAGIKLVLVSKENSDDVDKIKKENPHLVGDNFEVKLVDNLKDVLGLALVDFNEDEIN